MPSSKRDRRRENRRLGEAARAAALRRRRLTRLGGLLVVVVALVIAAVAIASGGTHGKAAKHHSSPGATPSPSGSLAPAKAGLLPRGCRNEPRPAPGPASLPSPSPGRYARPGHSYEAVIHTNCGDISMSLDPRAAPRTVNDFVYLARKGFYAGLYWHRIVRNFVIQAGDPNGLNGVPPDGPGYTIPDEYPPRPDLYTFGTVAMANTGQPHSGGSQFFIIVHENKKAKGSKRFSQPAGLTPTYTIFGRVKPASYPVLERIAKTPVVGGTGPDQDEPVAPVFITGITVSGG